jgi:YbbR domain-containing protein
VPRALRIVTRNWPLKLGAVALATVLYAGLVLSQNARTISVRVPIDPLRQPVGAFLLDPLREVTSIQFYAPADIATRVTSEDFTATADLSAVQQGNPGVPSTVPIVVTPLDDRIRVIDFRPRLVSVRLDPVITRTVPIIVDQGEVPPGLSVGTPELDQEEVTVRGARTLVEQVERVVASVAIDPNAIHVDTDVELVAVDVRGQAIRPVEIQPDRVRVRIEVGTEAVNRSVPVRVVTDGTVASGYQLGGAVVDPPLVTVRGPAAVVAALPGVDTEPVDVSGRTTSLSARVALTVPQDVTIVGTSEVDVELPITAQQGSRALQVGVALAGARSDRSYAVGAQSVVATLGGAVPLLARIDGAVLSATLDVTALAVGVHQVPVVFRAPDNTRLLSVSPVRIQVTVSVPATTAPTAPPPPAAETAPPALAPSPVATPSPAASP